jgi:WD40 repeat protein
VAFSPDGRKLAIAGGDSGADPPGELVLWNLAEGKVAKEFLEPATAKYVRWTAFSPDGKSLAACGTDKTVTIRNVATGKLQRTLRGHTALVHSVAFSPDGTRLASGSFDRSIRFWDVQTGESLAVLEGHEAEVRMVAFAPDGKLLLSTSEDKTARLWDTETFEQVTVMRGHEGWVLCGAFAPDGRQVVTAGKTSGGRCVLLRDVPSGDWGDMRLFPSQTSEIYSVSFSPDGSMLAIAGGFDNFQIWKRTGSPPEGAEETEK